MAKKIRFPLEMEDGIEVRTIDELKDNFSLQKVLQYLENGKLITWLRDRYSDDIADAIENLDKADAELSKKLCEIFEVDYNEQDDLDMEKIEERNRKLALLKQYTDEKRFVDVVDYIAFEQDDLYDLLDEGAETIYLCGEKFSIPLGKGNVSYIGINNPVAVISSKEAVDFEAKGITFENCVFDEKYSQLISSPEAEKTTESEDIIETPDLSPEEQEQIAAFVENMLEDIDDATNKALNYTGDEYINLKFNYVECKPSAYGHAKYIYPTRASAKTACKAAVSSMVSDKQMEWERNRKVIISDAKKYFDGIADYFSGCMRNLANAYDEYTQLECQGAAAEYLAEHKLAIIQKHIDFDAIFEEAEKWLTPEKDEFNRQKYFDRCDYNDYNGNYCYTMDEAALSINATMLQIDTNVFLWPDKTLTKYREAMQEYLEQLKEKIQALLPAKTAEESEQEDDALT